jgi:hypothetical protein
VNPDGVSIAGRYPLAHILNAQREGLRSPRLGECERALPDTNRCTDIHFNAAVVADNRDTPFFQRHFNKIAPNSTVYVVRKTF